MKAKNLKEFKALIERYETITLEGIKGIRHYTSFKGRDIAYSLTGFGYGSCTLCQSTKCINCVYGAFCYCMEGKNRETYLRIYYADTPTKLRNAFRARAKHMRTLLKSK